MTGTESLVLIGSPLAVGLIRSSANPAPGPGEVGEGDMGNRNSASGFGEVGERRWKPGLDPSGAVAVPGSRPLMLLSGGYEA